MPIFVLRLVMTDNYKTLTALADFLVLNNGESGVSIEPDVVMLISTELKLLFDRLDMLDDIITANPDIIAYTYHD